MGADGRGPRGQQGNGAVNKGTVTPLLSHFGWIFFSELSFGAMAHGFGCPLNFHFFLVKFLYPFS